MKMQRGRFLTSLHLHLRTMMNSRPARTDLAYHARSVTRWPALLVPVVALWIVGPYLLSTVQSWDAPHRPTWVGNPGKGIDGQVECDIDTWLIHNGLVAAPRFVDTLRWWRGTWVGQVPFYRPLTSLMFWTEWKLFGEHELRYGLLSILLFLLASYQFVRLASELYVHFRHPWPSAATLLAGLIFLTGLGLLPQQPDILSEVYTLWKNQPDTLCALLLFLALRAYLRKMPTEQPGDPLSSDAVNAPATPGRAEVRHEHENMALNPQTTLAPQHEGRTLTFNPRKISAVATGWYLAACLSKEAAILLPPILICLEWPELCAPQRLRRTEARARLLPLLLAIPLFLAWRAWCLHDPVGYRYGSNRSLWFRFASDVCSTPSQYAANGNWLPLILGSVLLGVIAVLMRRATRKGGIRHLSGWDWVGPPLCGILLLACLALPMTATTVYATHDVSDLFIALLTYCVPTTLRAGIGVCAFLGAVSLLLKKLPRLALFCYLWALLILLPTLASPAVMHRFYLMNAGYSLLLAAGLTAVRLQAGSA